jgi:hypothetical protein
MYDEGRVDVVNIPRTPCIFMLSCEISYEQVPPTIGMSAPAGISLDAMGHFEEEPGASSGVVDPHVDEARRDNIAALLAERPRRAQGAGQYLVVNAKIGEYVLGTDEFDVAADRAARRITVIGWAKVHAQVAHARGDRIGQGKELLRLLLEQMTVFVEIGTAHLPEKACRNQCASCN